MNNPRTLTWIVAAAWLAACDGGANNKADTDVNDSEPADTEVMDTEVVDTELADTDVVDDTEVEDTDVVDTDSPSPCAFAGDQTRLVYDPSTATASLVSNEAVQGGVPISSNTLWSLQDTTEGSLNTSADATSALIVEFNPPIVLQRAPSNNGFSLNIQYNYTATRVFGGDPSVTVALTTEVEGELVVNNESASISGGGGNDLRINWYWNALGTDVGTPEVGDTLTCVRFELTPSADGPLRWNNVRFNFNEADDTTGMANPLVAP